MHRKIAVLMVMFACLSLPLHVFANKVSLERMSVHHLMHQWKFSFYLNGPVRYRTFKLANPNRFVLDLQNVKTLRRLRYKALLGTPIKSLRYSAHINDVFRIVFDLSLPVNAVIKEVPGANSKEHKLVLTFSNKTHHVSGFGYLGAKQANMHKNSLLHNAISQSPKKKSIAHVIL